MTYLLILTHIYVTTIIITKKLQFKSWEYGKLERESDVF